MNFPCDYLNAGETRCVQPARFLLWGLGHDDYAHSCGDHVEDLREPHHVVFKLGGTIEIPGGERELLIVDPVDRGEEDGA